jgi:solute carrier family 25 (mitochondrial citrate transporter), member 1
MFASILAGGIAGATETIITVRTKIFSLGLEYSRNLNTFRNHHRIVLANHGDGWQYPAEFVKTRRQLPIHASQRISSSSSILLSTVRNHGFGGLYSGCRVLVISNFCKSSVRFFSFETARTFLSRFQNPSSSGHSASVNVLAGLCAGVAESVLVVTPGEALKTKFIHDAASGAPQFARLSLPMAIARTVRQDGILSLWRGVGPVLGKQGTNSAVRFGTYGILQEQISRRWPGMQAGAGSTLIVGALSGVVTV